MSIRVIQHSSDTRLSWLESDPSTAGCGSCMDADTLPFKITFAFQPIVNIETGTIHSYEALVRGVDGEGALSILGRVDDSNRYRFDQTCRVTALELSKRLGIETRININFLPNAVYEPRRCIATTVSAAKRLGIALNRLVFEVTEGDRVTDPVHLKHIMTEYQQMGMSTAIDDFGAGYAGLNLLAEFQPDELKLDIALVRGIDCSRARQAIVRGVIRTCADLGIAIVAEGVETYEEFAWLASSGVSLFQGYYFAKPLLEGLPKVPEARLRLTGLDGLVTAATI